MKIRYEDEYDQLVFEGITSSNPPAVDCSVVIGDVEWVVRSVTFYPEHDGVVVSLSESMPAEPKQPTSNNARLSEMQRAIVETTNRQNLQDKRVKSLREQTMSIRQHINRNQPKPKEQQ
jgi:hypothetical protein